MTKRTLADLSEKLLEKCFEPSTNSKDLLNYVQALAVLEGRGAGSVSTEASDFQAAFLAGAKAAKQVTKTETDD